MELQTPFVTTATDTFFGRIGKSAKILLKNLPVFILLPILVEGILQMPALIINKTLTGYYSAFSNFLNNQAAGIAVSGTNNIFAIIIGFAIFIGLILLGIFLSSLLILAIAFAVSRMDKNQESGLTASLKYGMSKIFSYFAFLWHLALYVLKIPFIFLLILAPAVLLKLPANNTLDMISNILVPIAGFGLAISMSYALLSRGLRTTFGVYLLVDQDLSGKEALEKSKELSQNRRADIFLTLLGLGLMMLVINIPTRILLLSILSPSTDISADTFAFLPTGNSIIIFNIVSSAEEIILSSLFAIFLFLYMRGFQVLDRQKANPPQTETLKESI